MHDTFCNLQKCTQIQRQLQKPTMCGSSSSTRPTQNQGRTSSSRWQRPCQPWEGLLRGGGQGASCSEAQGSGGHPLVGDQTVLTGLLSPEEFLSACGWGAAVRKPRLSPGGEGWGEEGRVTGGRASPGVWEPSHCRQNVPCVFGRSVSPVSSAPRRGRTLLPPLTDVPSMPCCSAHRAPAPECQHLLSAHGTL